MDKRKKLTPKFRKGDLVRSVDKKDKYYFSKGETTYWSYEINSIIQVADDNIPKYWINLFTREMRVLPKKSGLTTVKKEQDLKKLSS